MSNLTATATVTAGIFAVVDADGNAVCHSARQDKGTNSAYKARVRSAWLRACLAAGVARYASDGTLELKCSESGRWLERGAGQTDRDGYADFGHDVADADGGAYCGCNAAPLEGQYNRESGNARLTFNGWSAGDMDAYHWAWCVEALNLIPQTRARRAV